MTHARRRRSTLLRIVMGAMVLVGSGLRADEPGSAAAVPPSQAQSATDLSNEPQPVDTADSSAETSPAVDLLPAIQETNRIVELTDRYGADIGSVRRFYRPNSAPEARARFLGLTTRWLAALAQVDAEALTESEREQLDQFRLELANSIARQTESEAVDRKHALWLPYAESLHVLAAQRWQIAPVDAAAVAQTIDEMAAQVEECERTIGLARSDTELRHAMELPRLLERVTEHRDYLREWNRFYDGYDPEFSWWVRQPFQRLDGALTRYRETIQSLHADAMGADGAVQDTSDADTYFALTAREIPDVQAILQRPRGKLESMLRQFTEEVNAERQAEWERRRGRRARAESSAAEASSGEDKESAAAVRQRQLERLTRERTRLEMWQKLLRQSDFAALEQADRADYLLFANFLAAQQAELTRREQVLAEQAVEPSAEGEEPTDTDSDAASSAGRDREQWTARPPVGRTRLLEALQWEMIPYAPEELLEIAEQEHRWCEQELLRAARELGHGDDWHAAIEQVKGMHVRPGEQPQLIQRLAMEAIQFLEERDLVTVPPLAAETWAMEMMTPERQLVNPFFTGGPVISVSFPTDGMSHDAKLRSLRGNNIPFARATVHHELIPGHNLQAFAGARYRPDRRLFGTPFWTEGWALYWEMRLYDLGFAKTPEDRIGFLVWRSHRCARIVFSLSYHLGRMTPEECVDLLVARVGFERRNAAAEVRRSFEGDYPPLYQAAYMLGGLQLRQLHAEIVGAGKMTERQFHDRIVAEGNMPIVMTRALLLGTELSPSGPPAWRFYD